MSQPFDRGCEVPAPAKLDESLDEFWSGNRVIGNLKDDSYDDEVMLKLKRMVAGSQLYRNLGDLKFDPVGKKLDLSGIGWAYAPALTDLDNDGFLDLYATSGFMSRSRDKPDG